MLTVIHQAAEMVGHLKKNNFRYNSKIKNPFQLNIKTIYLQN